MGMRTFASAVEAGNFIRIVDHKAQDRYRLQWWKVQTIEITRTRESMTMVNRHGQRGSYSGTHVKVDRWTPGEDNRDEM